MLSNSMEMNPRLYLYREIEDEFELYLGEFSTLDGLSSINANLEINVILIGASEYKKFGWATKNEFPVWKSVQEVKSFFEQEDEFGLIDFEIELVGFGNLSTHDDGECIFRFKEKRDLIDLVKTILNPTNSKLILSTLLDNPGKYIELEESEKMNIYDSFDQYLKEIRNREDKLA